jgi:hypothetical protein
MEMKMALGAMKRIMAHPCAAFFSRAIDPDQFPSYYEKISDPLDLSQIHGRLQKGSYRSLNQWVHDMRRVRDNALKFFGAQSLQGALANHLMRVFDKEYEFCTGGSVTRWTRLSSSLINRLFRRMARLPEPLGTIAAVSLALKHSIPRPLIAPADDGLDEAAVQEQDRFLEAIGMLPPHDARALIAIIQRFHPDTVCSTRAIEIPVDALEQPCWDALVAHARKRFMELGLAYPSPPAQA